MGYSIKLDKSDKNNDFSNVVKIYKEESRERHSNIKILGKGSTLSLESDCVNLSICSEEGNHICVDPSSIISSNIERLMILGLPGSGKTTLLNRLMYEYCSEYSNYLPVFFRIVSFCTQCSLQDMSIFDFLFDVIEANSGKNVAGIICEDTSFCRKNTVLLMDGLDEINASDYEMFLKKLQVFMIKYPYCKIIISSRVSHFKPNDFNMFSIYILRELDVRDIEEYINKNCPDQYKRSVTNIITSDDRLLEMAKTPFLLAMMCLNPEALGKKAKQRALLYESCTKYLLKERDWQQGRHKETPEKVKELEEALQIIAVRFFKLDNNDAFPVEDVLFYVKRHLKSNTDAKEILDSICSNSGLLQLSGSYYYFVHRSIWEYFVAQAMRHESTENLLSKANILSWEEPIRMYVGLMQNEHIDSIIKGIWERNKTLALRCMHELPDFPVSILENIYLSIDKNEKLSLINSLRSTVKFCRCEMEAKRMVLDTVSAIAKVEKDCEVIFSLVSLLEERTEAECHSLVSEILDLANAEKRREKYINENGLYFVKLNGGAFMMGSDNTPDPSDKPEHEVNLNPFEISSTLVTNKIYYDQFPFACDGRDSYSYEDNHPVNNVTWFEAYIFARWLNCDLPTEAEWEYACRSGGEDDANLFNPDLIDDYAWYGFNSDNKPHHVATKRPNSFGIYDMLGNLREWCKDWYDKDYYAQCKNANVVHDPEGPQSGTLKVLRGGCFEWSKLILTPTYRNFNVPNYRNFVNGFRLVYKGSK